MTNWPTGETSAQERWERLLTLVSHYMKHQFGGEQIIDIGHLGPNDHDDHEEWEMHIQAFCNLLVIALIAIFKQWPIWPIE